MLRLGTTAVSVPLPFATALWVDFETPGRNFTSSFVVAPVVGETVEDAGETGVAAPDVAVVVVCCFAARLLLREGATSVVVVSAAGVADCAVDDVVLSNAA